jgi:TaqI-like C-terminal specificity domain/Eco57I restriction-modification methylase
MALFQPSVQKKYIAELDKTKVNAAYQRLVAHFGNPVIQENIRKAKEEQYQEGFLRELFVDVLGYTLNPQPNFNLTTEQKNEKNSKKADGAILKNGNPIAIIELKSLKTTDLQAVELQAFSYKNNQKDCIYVVTSNFQKLRFYIENAIDFEEFDLFDLTRERFNLLYLCLHAENVLSDLPSRIKKASIEKEASITQKLYTDYSHFKQALFADISARNKGIDALTALKKTQKLLDRFLFIFFAEDKGLLPPNAVLEVLNQWEQLKKLDAYTPLYHRFKMYFGYLNEGRKGENHTIFAYNGGLFAPDAVLDGFSISDNILEIHCRVMSSYDFDTEVDTNVLGHIFEHSLNEIDELEHQPDQKVVGKRKKDGIFYTPKYITKYIIDNTIGVLCRKKKIELQLDNEALIHADTQKDRDFYHEQTKIYRNWLLQLTIIDPACGSGAFLNEALVFLIAEHQLIDSMVSTILETATSVTDNVMTILENNIFGVDINEESVEISRLSLWLRTAKVGRKLNDLSKNIKCGNSLINDPKVAGELAFDWQTEFPQVFEKGGFDVVIGNPPYVRHELLTDFKPYFSKTYQVYNFSSDLFAYFYERAFQILKIDGMFGFISNTFDKTTGNVKLRKYLQEEVTFFKYIDFTDVQIFDGATTYPVILTAQKAKSTHSIFDFVKIPVQKRGIVIDIDIQSKAIIEQSELLEANWIFKSAEGNTILQKMTAFPTVEKQFGKCYYGIKTGLNEAFVIPKTLAESAFVKPIYEGKELKKWHVAPYEQQLILFKSKWTRQTYSKDITEEAALARLKMEYPYLMEKLLPFEKEAKKRADKGDFWWEMRNCAYYHLLEQPKIVFPNLQNTNKFAIDRTGTFINAPAVFVATNDMALLAILNSKLVWYFLKSICVVRSGGYIEVKPQYFEQIPVPICTASQSENLGKQSEMAVTLTTNFQKINQRFQRFLQSNFPTLHANKKIETWYEMSFSALRTELAKQKMNIPIKEMMDFQEVFEESKAAAKATQQQIIATERAIDALVYQLYELTSEEIELISRFQ